MLKHPVLITALLSLIIVVAQAEIEKRQVGMLARSGELPNLSGKRSVGALARNGDLPGKRSPWDESVRIGKVTQWLRDMEAALLLENALEHDVAKRNMEAMARAGYLVKPATESPDPHSNVYDSEEFLGKVDLDELAGNDYDGFSADNGKRGGLASLARHGYIGKRQDNYNRYETFLSPADKRHLASVKSFISRFAKRNLGAFRNFSGSKRHVGAARNFAMSQKRSEELDEEEGEKEEKRNVGSARRFTGSARNEIKRNLGAARQFFAGGSKKNLGAARSFMYGKRNLASLAREGGLSNIKHPINDDDYPWQDDDQFDFDDFHDEEEKRNLASFVKNLSGKRYLGSVRAGKRGGLTSSSNDWNDDGHPLASVLSAYQDDDDFLGSDQGSGAVEKRETKESEAGQGHSGGGAGGTRNKRSTEYAFSPNELPIDLRDYNDYEDAIYPNGYEKRFLGEQLSDSWPVSKRHIGALARMGLLPSFRSTRYSRSGRALTNRIVPFREDSSARTCFAPEAAAAPWPKTPSAAAQLALRRSGAPSSASHTVYATQTRAGAHPMAFHKSYYG